MSGDLFMMGLWKYVDAKKLDNKSKANIFLIMFHLLSIPTTFSVSSLGFYTNTSSSFSDSVPSIWKEFRTGFSLSIRERII